MNNNKKAIVYTLVGCPWCAKVKRRLRTAGYVIVEHKTRRDERAPVMLNRRRPKTYPQVFIGGKCVGGYEKTYSYLLKNK